MRPDHAMGRDTDGAAAPPNGDVALVRHPTGMDASERKWQEMDQMQRALFLYCVMRLRQQPNESREREA
jgi:hypothetical protein